MRQTLHRVALAGRPGGFDVAIDGGRVSAITSATDLAPPEWLALPSLVNMHAHANRAFVAPTQRPLSLGDAAASAKKERMAASVEDIHCRALKLFDRSIAHGVSSIRTHTDVDLVTGMRAVEGVLEAARAVESRLDVEIVAFASSAADPGRPETRALFEDAVRRGAGLVGGVPALCARPTEALDALLDAALALDVHADIHLDEHLDPSSVLIDRLVEGTVKRGLQGRVTVSHACVLSILGSDKVRSLLDGMAEAKIALVVLPELNLYLQGRGAVTPQARGLAPVAQALRAGVSVRFGTDNVRDWFFPFGDADMLETGFVGAIASHVDGAEDLSGLMCGGRRCINVGEDADLLLMPATSFDDALARRPAGRILLRRGQVVEAVPPPASSGHGPLVEASH